MPTFLLTWKQEHWPWPNVAEAAQLTGNGSPYRDRWSCGHTKRIRQGDRVFLLKQGNEPRGIVASGWVFSDEPYLASHWDAERASRGEQALGVDVEFDRVLLPVPGQPLPPSLLTVRPLADVNWNTQSSGIEIEAAAAEGLERLWHDHLEQLHSGEEAEQGEAPAPRNPAWRRDELILALDLYFRHPPATLSQQHPEVVALSELLNALPIHPHRPDEARFRNPNNVYMKLCNFLRLDPSYQGFGLQRGGRLEEHVWQEYADHRDLLASLAEAIRRGHQAAEAQQPGGGQDEDEDGFPEGRVLYRLHRARERNRGLVKQVKDRTLRLHGRLACVACTFDFAVKYGQHGEGYIECHHTSPLSELAEERETRPEDVVLVCSNCHRMLHRRRPWLTMDRLAELLLDTAAAGGHDRGPMP
jgi:5-methylcytosine-specific restriction protein A